jgi:hypothetical protein
VLRLRRTPIEGLTSRTHDMGQHTLHTQQIRNPIHYSIQRHRRYNDRIHHSQIIQITGSLVQQLK